MKITEQQILEMIDEFERRVQAKDRSMSVRIQAAKGLHGTMYLVHCENATHHEQYEVDAERGTWIRKIDVDG